MYPKNNKHGFYFQKQKKKYGRRCKTWYVEIKNCVILSTVN